MTEPNWISKAALLVLHERSLALHGGASGLRDEGLLEPALERPKNRHGYEGIEDIPTLAATYAIAVSSNHAFVDGNKRAAFLCCLLFLRLNGLRLRAAQTEAVRVMIDVAAGAMDIGALSQWLRDHCKPG